MIVDSSAIIALLRDEPEAQRVMSALASASVRRMSAFSLFESRVVLGRRYGDAMLRELDILMVKLEMQVEAFTADQSAIAFAAYQRFGKGTGHSAQLNLGDCAAYALAKSYDEPLLFVGTDFSKTDIQAAVE
ncbi:MAG: type II toxin-antitoxin system VapC family toxin [Rhodospirillales bacterium]|nr:type II toxin-antitoxin system VapC family toxin [Rhodospirillales bacterium]